MDKTWEINIDTLVGPTHHYGGLAPDNIASKRHSKEVSCPRSAALESLEKMWTLAEQGIPQLVLPPQERPSLSVLHRFGFAGTDAEILSQAAQEAPHLLSACSSSSSMWTANIATATPSSDTIDGKVHITPASLLSSLHRSVEVETTRKYLQQLFPSFVHHTPLPIGNEGVANHIRFCNAYENRGIHLFVYGKEKGRESYDSVQAVARLHGISFSCCIFAQQHPDAIDAGAFHNDLVAMGNQQGFICHEKAFVELDSTLDTLQRQAEKERNFSLNTLVIREEEIPLNDLLSSYFCNGQLVSLPSGGMWLLLPDACRTTPSVTRWVEKNLTYTNSPIREISYLPLRESMKNGGGPACLRLPLVLTPDEQKAVCPTSWLTEKLYDTLREGIETYYRNELRIEDLSDPHLLDESRRAVAFFREAIFGK